MRQNNRRPGRDNNQSSSFGQRGPRRDFNGPREMHKATCADCGNECEVPFVPKEDRPVYCRECFANHKPQRSFN